MKNCEIKRFGKIKSLLVLLKQNPSLIGKDSVIKTLDGFYMINESFILKNIEYLENTNFLKHCIKKGLINQKVFLVCFPK